MDYIIGDHTVITDEFINNVPEKIIRFPICYQVNNDEQNSVPYNFNKEELEFFQDPNKIVLANLNFNYKIDHHTVKIVNEVMTKKSNTIFFLLGDIEPNLLERFTNKNRVFFTKFLPKGEHIYRLNKCIDIIIDSVHCNSHTTASDALYAGVPIVTILGNTYQSRVCASILKEMKCDNLICNTTNEMVDKTIELIDLGKSKLREMKNEIRYLLFSSNIYNTYLYSEYFYQACYRTHQLWFENKPRDHINLDYIDEYNEKSVNNNFSLNIPLTKTNIVKLKIGSNNIILVKKENTLFINESVFNIKIEEDYLNLSFVRQKTSTMKINDQEYKLVSCTNKPIKIVRPLHFGYHPIEYHVSINK
jgi:hypothetical protein